MNRSRAAARMRSRVPEGLATELVLPGADPKEILACSGTVLDYYLPVGKFSGRGWRLDMRILISGASVAGPVLAYWLRQYGFRPTLVERAPGARKTGGHAVDLFRPAIEIVERMGVLPAILGKRTGTDFLTLLSEKDPTGARIDLARLHTAFSDRHVEIMREDLSEILNDATAGVEAIFGDSITGLQERPHGIEVTFERAAAREFDLVIGADGLH